ncbi:MAG: sensor domain-containing diguanylate cyclase [Pyrinomonadaceae bacterium]
MTRQNITPKAKRHSLYFIADMAVAVVLSVCLLGVVMLAHGSFEGTLIIGAAMLCVASLCVYFWRRWERTEVSCESDMARLGQLEAIVEATSDAIIGLDTDGIITSWNLGARKIYGFTVQMMIGQHISTLFAPEHQYELPSILDKISGGISVNHFETMHVRRKGEMINVSLSICPIIGARSVVQGVSLVARNITERKRSEELLHRQSAAMKASMDGMAIINHCGDLIYVNDAFSHIYGYKDPRDLVGKSWEIFYEPDELSKFKTAFMPACWRDGAWRGECTGVRRDNSVFPQELSITSITGGGLVMVARDITDRRRAEEALQNTLLTDPLTGLYTRRGFFNHAERHLALAGDTKKHLLLFIDLDGLKTVNDQLGHREGDAMLVAAAEVLKNSTREGDIVARLGGDEFTVLVVDPPEDHLQIVERIQGSAAERNSRAETSCAVSFSLGATPFRMKDYSSLDEVLAIADEEMYKQKRSKKKMASVQVAA